MNAIMRRLENRERWWVAELVLRTSGLVLLALCAGATAWLYGSVHTTPPHQAGVIELLAALAIVFGWCTGWPLLLVGQGLFKPVFLPGWRVGFTLSPQGDRDE